MMSDVPAPRYSVVTGVDYSELSRLALCTALGLAEKRHGVLHVITVAEGYGPPLPADLMDEERRLFLEAASRTLRAYVEEQATALLADPSSVRREVHAEIGNPADRIDALARKVNADLIVIGIAGRRRSEERRVGKGWRRRVWRE